MRNKSIAGKLTITLGAAVLAFGFVLAPTPASANGHDWNSKHHHRHYDRTPYYNNYPRNPGWNNSSRHYENYNGHRGYWNNNGGTRIFINI